MRRKSSKSRASPGAAPGGPFGRSHPPRDAAGKLTGTTRSLADEPLPPGGLHVRTVRAPVSHGRIRSISYGEGVDWSRVTIADRRDLPGPNVVRLSDGDELPALAASIVGHREEAVLLLAAADPELLERAVRAVRVDCEALPAVLTLEDARTSSALPGFDRPAPARIFQERGEVEAALAAARTRVTGTYTTAAHAPVPPWTHGMLAEWDGRTLTVQGRMDAPFEVQRSLMHLFGLPASRVRALQTGTWGGLGGAGAFASMVAAHAGLVAFKSGRPARLVYERTEDLAATHRRHASTTRIETGFDAHGRLVALTVDFAFDGGRSALRASRLLARAANQVTTAYPCANTRVTGTVLETHTVPSDDPGALGAPPLAFALEAHLDASARSLGLDPVELRRRNLVREGSTTAPGLRAGEDTAARACLEQVLVEAQWAKVKAEQAAFNRTGRTKRRGLGLSVVPGFDDGPPPGAQVRIETLADGRFRILSSSVETGESSRMVLAQLVARAIGLDVDDVVVAQADTHLVPDSGDTASAMVRGLGRLLVDAARQLKNALERRAGRPLDTRTRLLDAVRSAHREGLVPAADVRAPLREPTRDDAGPPGRTVSWLATVASVEVDLVTGETRVPGLWMVGEAGLLVNPLEVRARLHGGALEAVGRTLFEDVVWKDGTMWNAQLMNDTLPTSVDAPRLHATMLERHSPDGPFGANGLGALPRCGPSGAIVAAIRDAVGVLPTRLPATPERLLDLLDAAGPRAIDVRFPVPTAPAEAR